MREIPVNNSESVNSWRMVAWILASVAKSMLLVASSNTMTELRRRRALAMAISCLCPWEKFVPPADTFVSSEMKLFGDSTSAIAVESLSNASSRSSEGYLEETREEAALCSLDVRCDAGTLSEIRCTLYKTSKHSSSSCSARLGMRYWNCAKYHCTHQKDQDYLSKSLKTVWHPKSIRTGVASNQVSLTWGMKVCEERFSPIPLQWWMTH